MAGPVGFMDIEMRGDATQVDAMLARISSVLSGPLFYAYMAHLGEYVQGRTRDRFSSEGDDVTGKWHPLSSATQHWRVTQGFPADHPINRRTGQLEAYLTQGTYSVTPNALGATMTYPGTPAKGWTKEKLKTAQQGKQSPATPARPVLGLNERDLLYVMTTLAFMIQTGGRP